MNSMLQWEKQKEWEGVQNKTSNLEECWNTSSEKGSFLKKIQVTPGHKEEEQFERVPKQDESEYIHLRWWGHKYKQYLNKCLRNTHVVTTGL